jgi:hypothetical protein
MPTCREPFGFIYNQGIPAGKRKPYDFYNTFLIPRPQDDPLRGSKHVAWLKYTNGNCIFNIVVFDILFNTYTMGMAQLKSEETMFWTQQCHISLVNYTTVLEMWTMKVAQTT